MDRNMWKIVGAVLLGIVVFEAIDRAYSVWVFNRSVAQGVASLDSRGFLPHPVQDASGRPIPGLQYVYREPRAGEWCERGFVVRPVALANGKQDREFVFDGPHVSARCR